MNTEKNLKNETIFEACKNIKISKIIITAPHKKKHLHFFLLAKL